MAQHHWDYQDDTQQPYQISIYHGDQSGHVIIYSNKYILFLDFNIKDDKVYSFYLGNDLLKLAITKKNIGYQYALKSDKNQKLIYPLEEGNFPRRHIYLALLFMLIVLIAVSIIVILSMKN